jgi:hypothetical protein
VRTHMTTSDNGGLQAILKASLAVFSAAQSFSEQLSNRPLQTTLDK